MASTKPVKQFDVYWVELAPTKGSEIQKTRPCVIVSPDEMNEALQTVIVVPLTSTVIDWPFRTTITLNSRQSSAACDQLRTVAKLRLRDKAGSVTVAEQEQIRDILQAIFSK